MNQETVNSTTSLARRENIRRVVQIALIGLCVFALSALYARYGASREGAPSQMANTLPSGGAVAMQPIQVSESLDRLAERLAGKLERNPDDGEGWALLGRAYAELGQHDKAVSAFRRAVARIGKDPQLNADYAESRKRLAGADTSARPLADTIRRFAPEATSAR